MAQRLAAIAQRLGLGNADLHKVSQRTRSLALSFSAPASPPSGIGWQSGAPLYRLIDLPRGALSGPVQEDKARAHAALKKLVGSRLLELHDVDLREVDGLCTRGPLANSALPDFEAVAAGDAGRKVRIISYRDFGKALGQALPGFERGVELQLRRADWHGQRLFLELDNHTEAFACAVASARRRGLELRLPGRVRQFSLQGSALDGHKLVLQLSTKKGGAAGTAGAAGKGGKGGKPKLPDTSKMVVRNVAFEATRKDILGLFTPFGAVKSCRLPRKFDGTHR